MNLRPPPRTDDSDELRIWREELYEFLKHPVFHAMEIGNVSGGNYTTFANDGAEVFVGTAGIPHGGMFMHEADTTINLVKDNWVKVTGYTSVGLFKNVTFVSDYALTVDKVGHYKVDWSFNGDTIGGNKDLKFTIFLNDVEVPQGTGRIHTRAAGEEIAISSNAFVDITDTSHKVDMRIMNLTDSTNIVLHGATFNIIQIGGT